MSPVVALLFRVAVQTVFGGLLGGLVLKPLATRIVKVDISMPKAWAIEFGAVFFSLVIVAIVEQLELLGGSGLIVGLGFVILVFVVFRTITYTQFLEGANGRNICALDALPLALAQSGVIVVIGVTVRACLAIGNHLGVTLI
jgi:hypothetical protein